LTYIYRVDHIPAIKSMRTSFLEAPLDLEADDLSLYSLYINPAQPGKQLWQGTAFF